MAWPYTYRWEKRSKDFLRRNPLCRMCIDKGQVKQAEVVDHIEPHGAGQDQEKFWDENNWQSLCKQCHDSRKQSQERLGYSKSIGTDGMPSDPSHPFNKRR